MPDSGSSTSIPHFALSKGNEQPWAPLEAAFARTSDAVFAKKPCGTILYANRAFANMFSTKGRPEGQKAEEILPEDIQKISTLTDEMVLFSKHPTLFSYKCTVDGYPDQYFNTLKFPLLDENGEVLVIFGVSYPCSREGGAKLRRPALDVEVLQRAAETMQSLPTVQREAMLLAAHGYINKEVAKRLGISVRSVENYRSKFIRLLNLKSSAEMAGMILQLEQFGLVRFSDSSQGNA